MDKDYYYVKYVDESNEEQAEEIIKIDVDYIDQIAFFATTLDPEEEDGDVARYATALDNYYNEVEQNDVYDKLVSSYDGRLFLTVNIALSLIEKDFRVNGINDENIDLYDRCLADYRAQIEYSKTLVKLVEE